MTDAVHHQAVLDAVQSVRRLPSISAAVLHGGVPVWTGSAGVGGGADVHYRIGSITKTLTAILVMQCRDAGLLDLDDRLAEHLPDAGVGEVTLRQLLSHTAGIRSEPDGEWWERTSGHRAVDVVAQSGRIGPAGIDFHYSNTGFGLLGQVVERVTGAGWRDLVAERVCRPLGMTRTTHDPVAPFAPGRSVHHLRGTLTAEPHTDTGAMAPAGQLWSTVTDLARLAGFLARGGTAVLAEESRRELCTSQRCSGDYGLGVMLAGTWVGHLGTMPGFQAVLLIDPDSGDGAVALTNATTGLSGPDLVRRLLAGPTPPAGEPWRPTERVPAWATELLGWWHWGNSAFELRWHNDRLEFHDLARGMLAEQFVLDEAGIVGHAGYHRGERLEVVRDRDGRINHLACATFVYTREPYDGRAPIPGGVPRQAPQAD